MRLCQWCPHLIHHAKKKKVEQSPNHLSYSTLEEWMTN